MDKTKLTLVRAAPKPRHICPPSGDEKLPDYILKRNEQAARAGLSIEKQVVRDGKLTTWYRGTEEQWRASGFIDHDARRFSFNIKIETKAALSAFSPGGRFQPREIFSLRRVSDTEFRASIANELLPEWIEQKGGDITAYGMQYPHGLRVVYVASEAALIASGVAPQEITTENCGRIKVRGEFGWHEGHIEWEVEPLAGGLVAFTRHVDAIERAKHERAQRPPEYSSPEAYHTKAMADAKTFLGCLRGIVRGRYELNTYGETTLLFDQETIEAVDELVTEFRETIKKGRVSWTKKVSAEQQQLAAVRANAGFARFMQLAIGRRA